jgi:hypothetical protein
MWSLLALELRINFTCYFVFCRFAYNVELTYKNKAIQKNR